MDESGLTFLLAVIGIPCVSCSLMSINLSTENVVKPEVGSETCQEAQANSGKYFEMFNVSFTGPGFGRDCISQCCSLLGGSGREKGEVIYIKG